jgi:hypothetical protein
MNWNKVYTTRCARTIGKTVVKAVFLNLKDEGTRTEKPIEVQNTNFQI